MTSYHDTIPGPVWGDQCGHGAEHYIASFKVAKILRHTQEVYTETFDLYLFPQKHYGTEVCLRYGNEPSEYASPGGLCEFMGRRWISILSDEYRHAIDIINELGMVKAYFEPNNKRKESECRPS